MNEKLKEFFDLKKQYQKYLQLMKLDESKMNPIRGLKRTFINEIVINHKITKK